MLGETEPQKQEQQQLLIANESVRRCRGNRKLQRLRRKYRARGINQHELEILLNIHQTIESYHQNNFSSINNGNKEHQNDLNIMDTEDSSNSMSSSVENQKYSNELQSIQGNLLNNSPDHSSISLSVLETGDWVSPQIVKDRNKFKRYNLCNDHWNQYSKLIPNYRNLSSQQFKTSLIKSIPMNDRPTIEQLLNSFGLLQSLQNIISQGLDVLIENSLYYFRLNFEQKLILLKYDITDAQLVKSFYDFKPNEQQISTIQDIWQSRVKSIKRAMSQKKKNHSLPIRTLISTDTINDISLHKNDSLNSLTATMQIICQTRLNTIDQCAKQLMSLSNTIIATDFFKTT